MLANFLASGDGHSLDPIAHLIEKDRLLDQVLPMWLWQDWSQGGLGISKPVIYMWIAGLLCCAVFIPMARKWQIVPRGLQNFFEPLLLFVRNDIVYEAIHPRELADKLVPFFWTLFFWILFMNVLGLTPYSIAASGQLSVTAALAVVSAVMIVGLGMKEQGPITYWKSLVPSGLPVLIVPLLFLIELVGLAAKPFALCIRLFANMTGGHIIIFVLLTFSVGMGVLPGELMPQGPVIGWGVAVLAVLSAALMTGFEIIIALVQAYVFTLLTATFVGMAVHPDH